MITFRTRPEDGIDWHDISVAGEHEELLAHTIVTKLTECSWEVLVSTGAEEFEPLGEGWLE